MGQDVPRELETSNNVKKTVKQESLKPRQREHALTLRGAQLQAPRGVRVPPARGARRFLPPCAEEETEDALTGRGPAGRGSQPREQTRRGSRCLSLLGDGIGAGRRRHTPGRATLCFLRELSSAGACPGPTPLCVSVPRSHVEGQKCAAHCDAGSLRE